MNNKSRFFNYSAALLCGGLAASSAFASSHREAPNITGMPKLDSTDFYAFNSYEAGRDDYITLIANYIPLQDAYGGPNYFTMDPNAVYSIHIDNNGDAVEDITFQFRFSRMLANEGQGIALDIGNEGETQSVPIPLKIVGPVSAEDNSAVNFMESYTLTKIMGDRRSGSAMAATNTMTGSESFGKPLDFIGNKTFSSEEQYETYAENFQYEVNVPGCEMPGRVFVGQRKDPFVVNLGDTFDLVNYVPVEADAFPGGIEQSEANDDLRYKNVTSLVLEVSKSCVTGEGNGVIGTWTTASLPQAKILNPGASFDKPDVQGGALTQVSRLGNPLVNEVVIGLKDKDLFSVAEPTQDGALAAYVTHPTLPAILNVLFRDAVNATLETDFETIAPTNFPRMDLVTAFLTGFAGVNQLSSVTASEMLRLNTGIAATPMDEQSNFGVAGDDLAGFPNGRRPGDDVVDIALRVVMGRLCHPIPVNGTDTDLGLCEPEDAPLGMVPFTDGAAIDATMFNNGFPYLLTPISGSFEAGSEE